MNEARGKELAIGRSWFPGIAPRRAAPLLAAMVAVAAALALIGGGWSAAPRVSATNAASPPQWMRASWDLELRRLVEGEEARGIGSLAAGDGRAVQVFQFVALPAGRAPPEAVFLPAVGGTVDLYINGAPIFEPGEASAPHLALPGTRAELIPVPHEYWSPGRNRIDLVVSEAPARPLAAEPLWGADEALRPVAARWSEWTGGVQDWAPPLALAASILCFVAAAAGRGSRLHLSAGLGTLAAGGRALLATPEAVAALGSFWAAADALLLAGMLLAAAALLPRIWGVAGAPDALGLGAAALSGLLVATALLAAGAAAAPFVALRPLVLEAGYGIGIVALSGIAAGAGGSATADLAGRFLRGHLYLSRLVRRQRQELDVASQALQEEMRRSAILQERQRLARDMHDGIGGQLVSLITRVRAGKVGVDEVEAALSEGLADLRLIVESLDSAGDSIAEALAAFRARAQPELEAAGIRLSWSQPDPLPGEALNPRWILDLYRFLQEAISNVVRHARARSLTVDVSMAGADVTIRMADDGIGISPESLAARNGGKGLRNMRFRARRLGADCEIAAGPGGRGTRIELRLPLAPPQSSGEMSPS